MLTQFLTINSNDPTAFCEEKDLLSYPDGIYIRFRGHFEDAAILTAFVEVKNHQIIDCWFDFFPPFGCDSIINPDMELVDGYHRFNYTGQPYAWRVA